MGQHFATRVFAHIEWDIQGTEACATRATTWSCAITRAGRYPGDATARLNRKIPFLKFFLKQQLISSPVLGLAWWALDFPFMKRYSRSSLKHPELKGKDLETTRRCVREVPRCAGVGDEFRRGHALHGAEEQRSRVHRSHLLRPQGRRRQRSFSNAWATSFSSVIDITIVDRAGGRRSWICSRDACAACASSSAAAVPPDLFGGLAKRSGLSRTLSAGDHGAVETRRTRASAVRGTQRGVTRRLFAELAAKRGCQSRLASAPPIVAAHEHDRERHRYTRWPSAVVSAPAVAPRSRAAAMFAPGTSFTR